MYVDEIVHRALVGVGRGTPGYGRAGPDRIHVDVGAVSVLADPGLLERVMANLADNALGYADDCPVRIGAARSGTRATITVADRGPGIPRDAEDAVFAPFQRLGDRDNTTGIGLGLSVVRGFVEAMGGTITATDTPGGGLTMVVDLPSGEENGDAPPRAHPGIPGTPSITARNTLITLVPQSVTNGATGIAWCPLPTRHHQRYRTDHRWGESAARPVPDEPAVGTRAGPGRAGRVLRYRIIGAAPTKEPTITTVTTRSPTREHPFPHEKPTGTDQRRPAAAEREEGVRVIREIDWRTASRGDAVMASGWDR
ncbi:probable sensory histidine kinase KdpD (plasmid) [Rhodococcus jostii RHA1]|uniref:histidine kinase n=1 Tax=Rhodococcus jostii (strain RHA1) TaxID=101510 RepID=Q0RY63_RHOJR|nr:probable sensory histidine kinase KdpD [Rhodococcus jostii RHA1]